MTAKQPCPECVETIANETGWLIESPFTARSGRLCWVAIADKPFPMFRTLNHNEDYDFQRVDSPLEFVTDSNLALRFARKSDAEAFIRLFDKFLIGPVATEHKWMNHVPKSPTQQLAEECPHGMTVEQAQRVLDKLEQERKDKWSTTLNPTNPSTIRKINESLGNCKPTDNPPRYVFGPWVEAGGFGSPFPPDSEFQYAGFPTVRCNPIKSLRTCPIRRAYRIGQTYLHDGRDCPLADDRTLVRIDSFSGSVVCRDVNWPNVTSFTPLDEGKSA